MTGDEPVIPPLPGEWTPQSATRRCAVEGRVAKLTGDRIVLGKTCTLQIVQHARGWLLVPYGVEGPDGCDGVLISTPDGFQLARLMGGLS